MNLISRLDPLVHAGTWFWNKDGKLQRLLPPAMDSDSNWIFSDLSFRCQKWHKIFWDLLSRKSLVHSHCQQCYKVVLIPRTFAELMKVEKRQRIYTDCKCGIDMRDYTRDIYGAYWYCRGLLHAEKMHKDVRIWAGEYLNEVIQEPTHQAIQYRASDITIKRGCTEFEIQGTAGDSLHWEGDDVIQEMMERWLDENLEFNPFETIGQSDDIKQKVRMKWMRWAHAHGDMTYVPFNGHVPLHSKCRTYHNDI